MNSTDKNWVPTMVWTCAIASCVTSHFNLSQGRGCTAKWRVSVMSCGTLYIVGKKVCTCSSSSSSSQSQWAIPFSVFLLIPQLSSSVPDTRRLKYKRCIYCNKKPFPIGMWFYCRLFQIYINPYLKTIETILKLGKLFRTSYYVNLKCFRFFFFFKNFRNSKVL